VSEHRKFIIRKRKPRRSEILLGSGDEIVFESGERIAEFDQEVQEILQAIGFPGAFVSDRSQVSDFPEECLEPLAKFFQAPVVPDSLLWELARQLRQSRQE
jgi:hypothetical protein